MRLILRLFLFLSASALTAQQSTTAGAPDTSAFRRLELPAPSSIRTGSGMPGPDYWQQRVDYVIRATLDTSTRSLRGDERITYTNNSPDTLRYLWLQLDQNVFNSESRGSRLFDPRSRFGTGGAEGGVRILKVGQPAIAAARGRAASPAVQLGYLVNGTVMRVDLARPLPPKAKQVLEISWSFPFGPNRNRMGIEEIDNGVTYEVAQWYPRLAVYDDVRGWNTEQYYGQGEFYLEYGSFDVSISLPADMIVAATGQLQNPAEVLTATQRSRLAQARTSSSTVVIRGRDEVRDPASRPAAEYGTLTWRFTADSVRDFAWAASRSFIWDAVGVNGGKTLAMSYYPPSTEALWKEATQYAKVAIENYSAQWAPYPYPTANNVRGIEGGMEYPMIVFCNRPTPETLYSVTDHEFGHTWFPMVVGSNERRYPWMDEGFNEFINYYNWVKKFGLPPSHRGSIPDYLEMATSGQERPVMTFADQLPQDVRGPRGVRQAGARATAAPGGGRRSRAVRSRVQGVLPPLGLQASHARRLLPEHRRRGGRGPELVLAVVALHHGAAGPGGGFDRAGRLGWRGVADLPAQRGGHPDAGGPRASDGRRVHPATHSSRGDLVRGKPLYRDRAGTEEGECGDGRPGVQVSRRAAGEQPLACRDQPVGEADYSTAICHRPLSMSLA